MTLQQILEQVRSLPRGQRRKLADALLAEIESCDLQKSEKQRMAALDKFLEMGGSVHTDFTDVSSDKYRHLADIYADNR